MEKKAVGWRVTKRRQKSWGCCLAKHPMKPTATPCHGCHPGLSEAKRAEAEMDELEKHRAPRSKLGVSSRQRDSKGACTGKQHMILLYFACFLAWAMLCRSNHETCNVLYHDRLNHLRIRPIWYLLNDWEKQLVRPLDFDYWQRYGADPARDPNLCYFLGDRYELSRTWSAVDQSLPTAQIMAGNSTQGSLAWCFWQRWHVFFFSRNDRKLKINIQTWFYNVYNMFYIYIF